MVGGCDIMGLSSSLINKNVNKQDVVILSKGLEVVTNLFIESYEHFKFQKYEI